MAEIISRNQNQKLGLTVTVSCVETEPKSALELEVGLTEHVVDCRHCLAMVLFRAEILDEVGCDEYKILLAKARAVCPTLTAPLSTTDHISEDILEEYCFNRACSNESARLEEHLERCSTCAKNLEKRLAFIHNMKAAFALLADWDAPGTRT